MRVLRTSDVTTIGIRQKGDDQPKDGGARGRPDGNAPCGVKRTVRGNSVAL
jgi:hypothetical protein